MRHLSPGVSELLRLTLHHLKKMVLIFPQKQGTEPQMTEMQDVLKTRQHLKDGGGGRENGQRHVGNSRKEEGI